MHVSTLAMTPRILGITSSFFPFHSEAEVANGCRHESTHPPIRVSSEKND